MGRLRNPADVPFHSQVRVARSGGILRSSRTGNRKVRSIDVQLKSVRQAVVELEIGSVLPKIRELGGLQTIKLIKKLEVPLSRLCYRRIVCVERQLCQQWLRATDHTQQNEQYSR